MEKLKNFWTVKQELEKRVEEYNDYKDIYELETLKKQLINTEILIQNEEKRLELIRIFSREEIVLDEKLKKIMTNIDHDLHFIKGIRNNEYQFDFFNEDLNIAIENKVQNRVYVSTIGEKQIKISKGEVIGYLVPNKVLEIKNNKQR